MTIILATGASGGHIFPALGVARKLDQNHAVVFMGSLGSYKDLIEREGFSVVDIKTQGFLGRSPLHLFKAFALMLRALFLSYQYLKCVLPDVVVGFGGYGSFAPLLSAVVLKCPTLLHEQNVVPGLANRILSKCVDKVAISFKESSKYFSKEKTVLTGCPVRFKPVTGVKKHFLKKYNLKKEKPVILLMGGSQGSQVLNAAFFDMLERHEASCPFQAVHLTGKEECADYCKKYARLNIAYVLRDFVQEINEIYEIADVVISRAGALSICEMIVFEKPAVIIPYPYAGGHQAENARVLKVLGLAEVIDQEALSSDRLFESVQCLLGEKTAIGASAQKHKQFILGADARLAQEIIGIAQ